MCKCLVWKIIRSICILKNTKYFEKHPTYLVCPRADDSKSSKNLQSTKNIGKKMIYKSTHLSCYLSTIYNVLRPKKWSQSTSFSAMSSTFYKPKIGQIYNLQLGLTSPPHRLLLCSSLFTAFLQQISGQVCEGSTSKGILASYLGGGGVRPNGRL